MTGATDDVLELLDALLRIDSVNPDLDPHGGGETQIADFVAGWGRAAGLRVEVVEPTPGRPSVVLRGGRADGGRCLMLCGHLDTVGLAASHDGLAPRADGDRLHARGAYDMKAGLAACLVAARDAVAGGLRGEVVVAAVADEEAASLGIRDVLTHIDATRIDAAVVAEPTERHIGTAHRGFIWHEIVIAGVAAHGSRPQLGADAILAAGPLLVALAELDAHLLDRPHRFLGPGNLHASLISGGTEESTIPDRCTLTIERRTLPGETLASLERDLDDLVARSRPSDPRITVSTRTLLHREPMETPHDAAIVQSLQAATGASVPLSPMSYWADSAYLSAAGIPTVLYGPEGEGAHADVEWVSLSGTHVATTALTTLVSDFCG